jgi:hypothetical protein
VPARHEKFIWILGFGVWDFSFLPRPAMVKKKKDPF